MPKLTQHLARFRNEGLGRYAMRLFPECEKPVSDANGPGECLLKPNHEGACVKGYFVAIPESTL